MTEVLSIKDMPRDLKIRLLQELGFTSDGTFVMDEEGNQVYDRYTNEPVQLSNMAIFPGSTIILDDNPLSISSFLEEFEDRA